MYLYTNPGGFLYVFLMYETWCFVNSFESQYGAKSLLKALAIVVAFQPARIRERT